MFVAVECAEDCKVGNILVYSEDAQKWVICNETPTNQLIGVLKTDLTNENIGQVTFAGTVYALAAAEIPKSGGFLNIVNGRATVGNNVNLGIVAPALYDSPVRLENSLVLISL